MIRSWNNVVSTNHIFVVAKRNILDIYIYLIIDPLLICKRVSSVQEKSFDDDAVKSYDIEN